MVDLQILVICAAEPLPKSRIVERAAVGLNEKSVYRRIGRLADQDLLETRER